MSKKSSVSIVGNNLSFEQVLFIATVVVPAIFDVLREEGIAFDGIEGTISKPKKLCAGKCEHCMFAEVCVESEVLR